MALGLRGVQGDLSSDLLQCLVTLFTHLKLYRILENNMPHQTNRMTAHFFSTKELVIQLRCMSKVIPDRIWLVYTAQMYHSPRIILIDFNSFIQVHE